MLAFKLKELGDDMDVRGAPNLPTIYSEYSGATVLHSGIGGDVLKSDRSKAFRNNCTAIGYSQPALSSTRVDVNARKTV